jgi:hypothetical protein
MENFTSYPTWADLAPSCRTLSLAIFFSILAAVAALTNDLPEAGEYLRWMFLSSFFCWWTIFRCIGVLAGKKKKPKNDDDILELIEDNASGNLVESIASFSDSILDAGPACSEPVEELYAQAEEPRYDQYQALCSCVRLKFILLLLGWIALVYATFAMRDLRTKTQSNTTQRNEGRQYLVPNKFFKS